MFTNAEFAASLDSVVRPSAERLSDTAGILEEERIRSATRNVLSAMEGALPVDVATLQEMVRELVAEHDLREEAHAGARKLAL